MDYCVRCRRKTKWSGNPKVGRTKNNKMVLVGNCYSCGGKKVRFISKGDGILSSLGIKIPVLSKIPILKDILF